MDKISVVTQNGLTIEADLIKKYDDGLLCFAQDRIMVVDLNHYVIDDTDILPYVTDIIRFHANQQAEIDPS